MIQTHIRGQETSRLNVIKYRVEKSDKIGEGGFFFYVHKNQNAIYSPDSTATALQQWDTSFVSEQSITALLTNSCA